tara:strand:- start:24 stop:185 length:162 start_codon:yes stop_codon:yes gene_type:complete
MYEYKVFEAPKDTSGVQAINKLLEAIAKLGWEPTSVDYTRYTVFARKLKILND